MPRAELTDKFCQKAKVGDHFDTIVRGLCFRVTAGGSKTEIFALYFHFTTRRFLADFGRGFFRCHAFQSIGHGLTRPAQTLSGDKLPSTAIEHHGRI